uniref:NB-ARC domain containing protein n=1 Tax=Solanum tuberosum TaxID=4113 RepID=M1D880_SOLTU
MVEAIKNNGDRVVDSCVQDDTLNTTVTLNCTLATVSQTLVLGSKESVTSDSVVPEINLESSLVLNPKLPTVGVLSGKDPSLATIEDFVQANKMQQCEENLDQIFESGGTCDHDITLKDNDKGRWTEVPSKMFSPGNSKLQHLDCTNPACKDQTINCEDKVSGKVVCSNTFDALMINFDQELHALSTPILQVSNPETTRIIKESHAAMLNKENPMSISKRNDKSLGKETSASRWANLVEEEEHISAPARSKLSPQAPIFVPSSKANPSMAVTIDNSEKILTITTKVLEKIHEPKARVSRLSPTTTYASDLSIEKFDEDEMLHISFDKVAKDGDLSPSQQRSGRNKNKNKKHER